MGYLPRMPCPVDRRACRCEALVGLGGFVVLSVAFVVVMDVRFPFWTDREYAARRQIVLDRKAEHPERPLLVVLGSSRVGAGFVPEEMGPIYDDRGRQVSAINFSHLGAGPRMNLIQLRRLLRDGITPDYLLVEFMPTLVHREPVILSQLAMSDISVLVKHWDGEQLLGKAAEYRLTAMSRYRANCLQTVAPHWSTGERVTLHGNGGDCDWVRPNIVDARKREELCQLVREQCAESMANWHVDPLADGAMRELLAVCREHDIRVAIVLFPESSTFRSWYGEGAEDRMREYLMSLAEGENVAIFDERAAMPDECFIDPHHLSAEGATRFTAQLQNHPLMRSLTDRRTAATRVGKCPNDEYEIVLRMTLRRNLVQCIAAHDHELSQQLYLVNCKHAPIALRAREDENWRPITHRPPLTRP